MRSHLVITASFWLLCSATISAKNYFNFNDLSIGDEVAVAHPIRVPLGHGFLIEPTAKKQVISINLKKARKQPVVVSIYDSNADQVQRVELSTKKPQTMYYFNNIRKVRFLAKSSTTSQNDQLIITSDKPLTVGRP